MDSKKYEPEFLDAVRATPDDQEQFVACCDFSRGPWWKFNGIRTLVLTDKNLRVYMAGLGLTARQEPQRTQQQVIPITTVRNVSQRRRRSLLGRGEAVVLKLELDRGRRVFTSKHEEAADFARELRERLTTR